MGGLRLLLSRCVFITDLNISFGVLARQLKATIDGFQLILIGDLHELPLLHLHTKPFTAEVHDWSGDLKFLTSSKVSIKYYNLTNSAWEPLLEPWQFMFRVRACGPEGTSRVG